MPPVLPASARIPWHRRSEAVVVAGSSLLVAISIGAMLVATTRLITTSSLARAATDLEKARGAFYHLIATRSAEAASQARLVTALPLFRAHINEPRLAADPATMQAMADEYRQQLTASFCIVTDRSGAWIAASGWTARETPPRVTTIVASALEGRAGNDLVSIDDHLFLVVAEPARFAEETLGTFTVSYPLDDRFAAELAAATNADITFATGRRISGSSARPAVRSALEAALQSGQPLSDAPGGSATIRNLGDGTFVAGTSSLFPDRASTDLGALVLLQDWQPTQQFLDELRFEFILVGFLVFGVALAGGIVFSRGMSRPLRDISDAAKDIAGGNWNRQVPVRGRAEAVTMASAFNEMTATVRHWYEEAKDRSERLQASYDRFKAVTDSARDGIVAIDAQGAVRFWNRSAAAIFGCGEQEAIGMPFARFIDEVDKPKYLEAIAYGMTDVAPTIELIGVRKDGTRFPIELLLSPSGDASTRLTAIVRDITDRRHAEAVLREREEELRQAQKMEAIGRLAGGVAHDFNNLLTAIQGFAELLRLTTKTNSDQLEYTDEIMKATDRAAQLTRQLLAFSRRQVLAPRVIALDKVLETTEKMLRRLIGEDVVLTCTSEPALARVKADPGQMEQAILNLAINARDAMPNGGRLTISLSNVELDEAAAAAYEGLTAGRYVQLDVADNGIGMNAETMSKIFEPFFTTKGEGKGTGLGLALVYGLVRQSGGSIDVDSKLGQGTRFRILLPQCEEDEQTTRGAAADESPHGSEILLLVEDDEVVRELLGMTLRRYGYTVLEAPGALAALEVSRSTKGPIHLLLTDVVMPQMSGRRLAELLQTERADTRVLFMSGYSDDAVLRAGVQAYEMPFIQKPFSAEALAVKIRETLA